MVLYAMENVVHIVLFAHQNSSLVMLACFCSYSFCFPLKSLPVKLMARKMITEMKKMMKNNGLLINSAYTESDFTIVKANATPLT